MHTFLQTYERLDKSVSHLGQSYGCVLTTKRFEQHLWKSLLAAWLLNSEAEHAAISCNAMDALKRQSGLYVQYAIYS